MNQKGFAPILLLVGILVTALATGEMYFFTTANKKKLKQAQVAQYETVNNTPVESTPSSQPVLENKIATQSSTPSPTHSTSAIEILKKRPPQTPVPTPTSTPVKTASPTPSATPNPACNTNTDSRSTTVSANSDGAVFSLSPNTGTYKRDEDLAVQINIDPRGRTIDAVDALLKFDPAKLSIVSIIGKIGSYNNFNFSSNTYDNSKGEVYLSLTDSGNTGLLKSNATLAVINFKISNSASGNVEVKFDFDPNNPSDTTDANVVERNNVTDALGSVTNGFYTIKPAGCN